MEMAYCYDKGIPHTKFLSWAPEDRAKVIAYGIEQTQRCHSCGTAPWEWEQNKFAYTPVEEFCQGCYQKSVFSDTETRSMPGTSVKLVPTTPMMKAKMQVSARKRARRLRQE